MRPARFKEKHSRVLEAPPPPETKQGVGLAVFCYLERQLTFCQTMNLVAALTLWPE